MSQQTWTPLRGYPDWLILGFSFSHFLGDPPISGGRGGGVKILPISYIYREVVLGGAAVTTRRGGGYRTHSPVPEAGAQHYRAGGERRRFSVTYSEFRLRPPKRPPISGGVLPPILGGFGGYTPQKRQKRRSGVILGATANFGASIL